MIEIFVSEDVSDSKVTVIIVTGGRRLSGNSGKSLMIKASCSDG